MKTDSHKRSYVEVTPPPVTLMVLELLDKGMYAKQIAATLKRSKVTIHRHIDKLKKAGLLQDELRTFSKIYAITDRGETAIKEKKLPPNSCRPTRIRLGVHLRIYIPILKRGRLPETFWKTINEKFRNSVIKHRDMSDYIEGVSVRETTRGLELNMKHRKTGALKDVIPLVTNSVFWAIGFFSSYGYELDHLNFFVNDSHNTIWTRETEEAARKEGRVTVAFDKERAKITPRDPPQQSKAWLDRTPEPNLETNDMDYAEAFIKMPFINYEMRRKLEDMEHSMAGYIPQQVAISNALNMQSVSMRELSKAVSGISEILKGMRPENLKNALKSLESRLDALKQPEDDRPIPVEITENTGDFMGFMPSGELHAFNLKKGARIRLERKTASMLIMNRKAVLMCSLPDEGVKACQK